MFMKTLTAGLVAATMTFTSVAPNTAAAEISEGDAIIGIATLLLLGAAIHNNNSNDAPVAVTHPQRDRSWRSVPSRCRNVVEGRNGRDYDFFALNCLRANYATMNRLPESCYVRFRRNADSFRMGYRTQCLRNHGFRTNQY